MDKNDCKINFSHPADALQHHQTLRILDFTKQSHVEITIVSAAGDSFDSLSPGSCASSWLDRDQNCFVIWGDRASGRLSTTTQPIGQLRTVYMEEAISIRDFLAPWDFPRSLLPGNVCSCCQPMRMYYPAPSICLT